MASLTMKSRKTIVTKQPYWVPSDNDGKGAWRYLPVGDSHKQQVEQYDPESGMRVGTQGVYEAKGWTPVYQMPADDPRRKLLPVNWQAYCQGRDRQLIHNKPADAA